jgi:hypothetical protein
MGTTNNNSSTIKVRNSVRNIGGHKKTTNKEETMKTLIMATLVATLALFGGNAMAQDDTDTSANTDTDGGVTDTDNEEQAPTTGLLSMPEKAMLYPGTDMFYLGLNAFPKNACTYFTDSKVEDKKTPKNSGFVVIVAKKLRGNDKKNVVNLANTGEKNMCALSPIVRQQLWDLIHAWLITNGCTPAEGADVNDLNTEWSGTCGDIKAGIKAVVLKAMEYADPESRAVMESILKAAEDVEITSGVVTLEIVFTQMALYFAPEDVWRPLFASTSVELGTLADASTVKVDTTVKAACVGKKPVVGKVKANGDTLQIELANGEIVEMDAKDCAVWTANSFPTIHDGLELYNKVVVLNKDDQLPMWGEIVDVVNDAEGKPTNIKVELDDGTEVDIALTSEQIVLGKKMASAAAGSVSFSLDATGWVGIGSTMPDHTKGVWAPTTMIVIRWTPEAMKGILSFHAGFGFGLAEGSTSYGIENASQTDRMFFIGKVGLSAGYDVLSWLRPEVMGSLLYTAHGVGGEGGADLVFKTSKYVNIRVGARVGYIPTGVVPDTRPGRNTPALNGLFVGPALSLEFCIPY